MSTQPTDPPAPAPAPADPHHASLNAACLDLLLIELVPMAHRLAAELAARDAAWAAPAGPAPALAVRDFGAAGGAARGRGRNAEGAEQQEQQEQQQEEEEEEVREAVFARLEALGYRVGLGVVERLSRDRPRPLDALDAIKFLCKDVWALVFRKQIDNLKTNHRGVYVLTDHVFAPLKRMSLERGRPADAQMAGAQPFLYFPAGLIRGALAGLGVAAAVQGDTAALPGATFQIRTAGARA